MIEIDVGFGLEVEDGLVDGVREFWDVREAECARLVPGPRADTLLAQALRDPNEHVADAAADAALQRPYSDILLAPLVELARGSAKKSLRTAATQVLARWLNLHPELRTVIEAVAQNDQDAELRKYASSVLAKHG